MIYKMSASWCQPCKSLTKTLTTMGLEVTEVDIDEDQELPARYHIRGVPTLVNVKTVEGGEIYYTLVGNKTAEEIREWLEDCEE